MDCIASHRIFERNIYDYDYNRKRNTNPSSRLTPRHITITGITLIPRTRYIHGCLNHQWLLAIRHSVGPSTRRQASACCITRSVPHLCERSLVQASQVVLEVLNALTILSSIHSSLYMRSRSLGLPLSFSLFHLKFLSLRSSFRFKLPGYNGDAQKPQV